MNIAVLLGGLLYDSQKSLLEGITDYAKEREINIFVFTCGGDIYAVNDHNKGEFQIYSLPRLETYDGVIIAPNTIQNAGVVAQLTQKLEKVSVPVISIDARMGDFTSFYVDNEGAMLEMTEHVISGHGKTRILYISGPEENQESMERKKGFLQGAERHRLREGRDYEIACGDFWIDSGRELTERYLAGGRVPEAVICANDYMAIGATEELRIKGYRVPEDVIVTGFDNSFDGRYHVPRITSVQKPLYNMGYAACQKLAEGTRNEGAVSFRVSCKFSESCGCGYGKRNSLKDFKRRMTREKNDNMRWSEILNSMSADLNELNTLTGFVDKLKQYVARMRFPYFYLCLCDERQLIGELEFAGGKYRMPETRCMDYTPNMRVAIAYEEGCFFPQETIRAEELLPKNFYKRARGVVSVVVPIHFRLHCMGYCVVGNSSFPMETIQFQSWIMNLGNGLENIRKQMLMQEMIEQLNRMWIYDTMTGVLNRAGFYLKAGEIIETCRREGCKVLLLFADIDRLKTVNDSYGHEEGDFYIKTVADICQEFCGEPGIVMRYGGDEFVMLQCHREGDSYGRIIDGIRQRIRRAGELAQKSYGMDASIGHYISEVTEGFQLEKLVEQADREMYAMKRRNHTARAGRGSESGGRGDGK